MPDFRHVTVAPHRPIQCLVQVVTKSALCSKTNLCLWAGFYRSLKQQSWHLTPVHDKLCLNWFKQTGASVTYTWPELPCLRTRHILLNNALLARGMEMTVSDNVQENLKPIQHASETKLTLQQVYTSQGEMGTESVRLSLKWLNGVYTVWYNVDQDSYIPYFLRISSCLAFLSPFL